MSIADFAPALASQLNGTQPPSPYGGVWDPVTGTLSREFLDVWLERERVRAHRHQRRWTLALAAVDHMSRWNGRKGETAGDQILLNVAGLLERTVRTSDIVARYEGDTFALVFPETEVFPAREVGAMLCLQIARHDWSGLHGFDEPVTISMGMVSVDSAQRMDETIARAVRNLERARTTGRNRVFAG